MVSVSLRVMAVRGEVGRLTIRFRVPDYLLVGREIVGHLAVLIIIMVVEVEVQGVQVLERVSFQKFQVMVV